MNEREAGSEPAGWDRDAAARDLESSQGATEAYMNDPLDLATLPSLDDVAFNPLHPRYRIVRVIGVLLGWVVPTVAVVVALVMIDLSGLVELSVGVLLLVAICGSVAVVLAEFPRRGWLLRDHDLSFRHGLVSQTVTSVPFTRVQHVSVSRGGVERALGLASVEVFTAGSGAADLVVPGLDADAAEKIKELVLQRTLEDD